MLKVVQFGYGNSTNNCNGTACDDYQLYILDYDQKYFNCVVIADTHGEYISVLSKTPLNLAGLQRVIDLAEEYGQDFRHLELQTSKCNYQKLL
jgi:hypothetical protein